MKVVEREHHLHPLFLEGGDAAWPEWAKKQLIRILSEYSRLWEQYISQYRRGEFRPPALYGGLFLQIDCYLEDNDIVIFEIENSIAGYSLLSLHPAWGPRWVQTLYEWSPEGVFLFTAHPEKHKGTLEFEWGGNPTPAQLERAGFVGIVAPGKPLPQKKGMLQPRTSRPLSWLRSPDASYRDSLSDLGLRREVTTRSQVPNVDDPAWSLWDPRVVNDSKAPYISLIEANVIHEVDNLFSSSNPPLRAMRAKPLRAHFGGYGHLTIPPCGGKKKKKALQELRRELKRRGPYLLQPEHTPPSDYIPEVGRCKYIDRVFCSLSRGDLRWKWVGGFRCFMPESSYEVKKNRIHGNRETIWALIW
ncbi:MAG: hypothetical protein KatS3mg099_199 [Candidatus Parcubacteria bacterium]|nr:MAG: hypothetical protein KatS3mg099_199 [Candidatus Parcubacteria bacterium]